MKYSRKFNNFEAWYNIYGYHRLDGPAIIYFGNNKSRPSYYIDDELYLNFLEYIQDVIEYKKEH